MLKLTNDLNERRNQNIPKGVYSATPYFAAHADGAIIRDVDAP